MSRRQPPKLADQLLIWLCKPELLEEIQGDLHAQFIRTVARQGLSRARFNYWFQVLHFMRPFALKRRSQFNETFMIRNYLKFGLRNILKEKGLSAIHISGLTIGIASFLLVLLFVRNEWSYDRHHQHFDHLYRVLHAKLIAGAEQASKSGLSVEDFSVQGNAVIGPMLEQNLAEVQAVCRISERMARVFQHDDKRIRVENMFYADASFFDLFSWQLLAGDPKTCLAAPNSIVITQSTAKRLFGDEDPMGQTLKRIQPRGEAWLRTVTGVVEDGSTNGHLSFDGIVSMATLFELAEERFSDWDFDYFYTYVLVNEVTGLGSLDDKINHLIQNDAPINNRYLAKLEPFADAYFHSRAKNQPGVTGNLTGLYIFLSIGFFILIIACVNFINLATARSIERAKEVGIRKTLGAHQYSLTFRFLMESMIVVGFATLLALFLIWLVLPVMSSWSGKTLIFSNFTTWEYFLLVLGLMVSIGLLTGTYPAMVLARYQPNLVLKGQFRSSAQGLFLRKGLIGVQFCISVVLMTGSLVAFQQLKLLQRFDLGFEQDQLITVDFGYDETVHDRLTAIKNAFLARPDVASVSFSFGVPNDAFPQQEIAMTPPHGPMKNISVTGFPVDADFIDNYQIELLAGRSFSQQLSRDTTHSLILNAAAATALGYTDPNSAIGSRFSQGNRSGQIIGVVRDFHYSSLHHKVEPAALWLAPVHYYGKFSIRLQTSNMAASLLELEQLWNTLVPKRPFFYEFLDQTFARQHRADWQFGRLFAILTGIAIFITCMGLFALTTFTVNQRTKEVGVRKILGASVTDIVLLLSKDIYRLSAFAAVIAVPISWYIMHQWLNSFAYRIIIGVEIFVAAILLILLVTAITISWQAIRAATSNPIDSLRHE